MEEYTLIITEKPDAAVRVAMALDVNGKPKRKVQNGVPYYEANRDKNLVIVPALGYLYTVASEKTGRAEYPVFDFRWVPLYLAQRNAKRVHVWLETIAELAKEADAFIDACDYDIEGSIIGYTILKYACGGKEKKAKRMKYSTLTREELEKSYVNALPTLDFNLIEAGLTRHEVDWLYGINLSRALMQALKNYTGKYVTLSTGRVQGPTLKFVALRERNIRDFVPTPYLVIKASVCINHLPFDLNYEKKTIETKAEADAIVKACNVKKGKIVAVEAEQTFIPPPSPFDSGSLQSEAYRLFKYTPMFTLKIAQCLYLDALISYPRTSSQKLPPSIGYRNIFQKLTKSDELGRLAHELLRQSMLKPKEGRGFDSAHPAIYPTGNLPERPLNSSERNVWNLVVKRFMSTFGENAVQKTIRATVDINGHKFRLDGKELLKDGWIHFYKPYVHIIDAPLPQLIEGQEVDVKKVSSQEEFTKPPLRYNPSSLLKRMQKENLGTKATRAGIIQTLYDRKYITEEKIEMTELGFEIINVLQKYCPTILSARLTAELEEKMNEIQDKKETRENVLKDAIDTLKTVTAILKEKEISISEQLDRVIAKAELEERTIGICPTCKTGKLIIIRSRKTSKRFIGCTNYFTGNCRTTFPLPQQGTIKPSNNTCRVCGYPILRVWQKMKQPRKLCINPGCPLKRKNNTETKFNNP
ncbi:MAG TPA: DNA topoisomerase I [Candidatus Sulfotelmatobacter sp.]|nr:DNA topoisomerase I [Candidatus Sulfotelmatobacter sp.]